ncbi:hypothetical protein BJ742DRAFT_766331 [Cladochytrium replicatum]|nr:hypothetical protein BJ742DRAFT_766331 [Cladochytrium replicatum]
MTDRPGVWFAFGLSIAAFLFGIGAFIYNIRRYTRAAQKQPDGRWTRFQKMMLVCLMLELLGASLAIVMMFMMLMWFPERLEASIACTRLTFNQGPGLTALSLMEVFEQTILELGNVFYFLVIMDRYYIFRLFVPGGTSDKVRISLYATGAFLYLVTLAQIVVANTGDRSEKLTKGHPHCIAAFVMQLGFVDMIGAVDIMVAYHLCLVALGLDQYAMSRSWSILGGSRSESRNGRSTELEHNALSPTLSPGEHHNAFHKPTYTLPPASPDLTTSPRQPQALPQPRASLTIMQRIMLTPHRRRVVSLLAVALSLDTLALALCVLPLVVPAMGLVTRAFELIAVHLVLMHCVASLWFLESFKEVVLAPKAGRSGGGGARFSSVTVDPEPVEWIQKRDGTRGGRGSEVQRGIAFEQQRDERHGESVVSAPSAFAFQQQQQRGRGQDWNAVVGNAVGMHGGNGGEDLGAGGGQAQTYARRTLFSPYATNDTRLSSPPYSPFAQAGPQMDSYGSNRYPRKLSVGRGTNGVPGTSPYSLERYQGQNHAGTMQPTNGFVNHWG